MGKEHPRPERRSDDPAETAGSAEDGYRTVADGPAVELKVRGSRFLARALHAPDEDSARAALEGIRRAYHKATHHCWGLRLAATPEPREIGEDAGEPAGTAGAPILAAMRARDLCNVLVAVTRWFGGTKLGKGGLARAYGEAAAAALDAAREVFVFQDRVAEIGCAWEDVGSVEAALARNVDAISRTEHHFGESPRFLLHVRRSRVDALAEALREATGGRAGFTLRPGTPPCGGEPPGA